MKDKIQFQHVTVDRQNPADPHCKAAGDISGNGYADLLAASASGGGLFWYRYPDWSKHCIAEGTFTTDMAVADIDRDGYLDVVIPSDEGLMCYVNPAGWGGDPSVDPWEAINVSPDGARMHDVAVADLNGNGKLDLITRHQSGFGKRLGNQVHLWVQESLDTWHHRVFPCPHGEGLAVAELKANGRVDVLIGGRWYENPGDVLGGEWIEHLYLPEPQFDQNWTHGDVVVRAGDLTGDGRLEIVLSPAEGSGRLSWFAAPEGQAATQDRADVEWTEHVIEHRLDHAHALRLADLDGDGWVDIVVAKMHQATPPQEVAVYLNQGAGASWDKQVIARTGSHNIALVDIGNTGRLDIYGANWNNRASTGGAIELWLNLGKP